MPSSATSRPAPLSAITHAPGQLLAPMVRKLGQRSLLGQAEIDALLALPCRTATIDARSYLVREGDRGDQWVVLLSGFVYLSKIAGSGARQILAVHLRGDLIDLHNGLLEGADHSVQALTHIEVGYIPHQAILAVADAYPAIARALWRNSLADAAVLREWLLNVGRRDARERICHLLCELAVRQEEAGLCDGPDYDWPMTQEQIGDATGLTSVHVNRMLQGMRNAGLISMIRGRVTITDGPRLQAAGDFSRAYLHQGRRLAA